MTSSWHDISLVCLSLFQSSWLCLQSRKKACQIWFHSSSL